MNSPLWIAATAASTRSDLVVFIAHFVGWLIAWKACFGALVREIGY
jgi:hypothetical protein